MSTEVAPSRRPRADARLAVMAIVFVAGCVYVVLQLVALRQTLDSERKSQAADAAAISQLSTALTTTRTQLQQHGVTPKAPPATTIVQGVPGATGPAGQSIVGPQGPPGKDGTSPDPNAVASAAAKLIHPSPGPQGPAGPAGQPGANSTVPGPQGPAGSPGATGQTGPPPSSWTWKWTDATGVTHAYQCTEDTAGGTTYTCTETGTSTPPPSPSPAPAPGQTAATTSTHSKTKPKNTVVSTGPR